MTRQCMYNRWAGMVLIVLASVHMARAQTLWQGPADGDWSDGGNWSAGVPTAGVDAYVGNTGGSSPVSAVITQGVTTATKELSVGDNVVGSLTMNGDYLDVNGDLLVGARTSTSENAGQGTLTVNSGTVYADGILYQPRTKWCHGHMAINGGTVNVDQWLLNGQDRNVSFTMDDASTLIVRSSSRIEEDVTFPAGADVRIASINVPYTRSDKRITITHYCTNTVTGQTGLSVASTVNNTSGTYDLLGGQLTRQHVYVARKSGGNGILNIAGDALLYMGNTKNTSNFQTGENGGTAAINLGDASSQGWFQWTLYNNFHIRMDASSKATLRGVGGRQSGWLNTLQVSGQVVADAWGGADRDLNMASSTLNNTVDNGTSESNGWYAVNGGRLILASKTVNTGNVTYNWGEDAADADIDLVNSVRYAFSSVATSGVVRTYLLAVDRDDVPAADQLGNPVAIHHVNSDADLDFDSLTMTIRYDSPGCAALGYAEPVILHSTGGSWTEIPSTVDTVNKRISVTLSDLSGDDYFAQASHRIVKGTICILK